MIKLESTFKADTWYKFMLIAMLILFLSIMAFPITTLLKIALCSLTLSVFFYVLSVWIYRAEDPRSIGILSIYSDGHIEETGFDDNTNGKPYINIHSIVFGIAGFLAFCLFIWTFYRWLYPQITI